MTGEVDIVRRCVVDNLSIRFSVLDRGDRVDSPALCSVGGVAHDSVALPLEGVDNVALHLKRAVQHRIHDGENVHRRPVFGSDIEDVLERGGRPHRRRWERGGGRTSRLFRERSRSDTCRRVSGSGSDSRP